MDVKQLNKLPTQELLLMALRKHRAVAKSFAGGVTLNEERRQRLVLFQSNWDIINTYSAGMLHDKHIRQAAIEIITAEI